MPEFIGIDPGPAGFAWACYDDGLGDVDSYGRYDVDLDTGTVTPCGAPAPWVHATAVGIEAPMVPYEGIGRGEKYTTGPALATAQVVGWLRHWLRTDWNALVIMVPRPTVKSAIPGCRANSTKAQVNAAMRVLCPALDTTARGLNAHTRDAAALAYVMPGQYSKTLLVNIV